MSQFWHLIEVGDGPKPLCPADENNLSILTIVEVDGASFAAVRENAHARIIGASPAMLVLVREYRSVVEYYIRRDLQKGDDEGANLKRMTVERIDQVLLQVDGRT